jgi:hypothetical protein
LSHFHCFSLAFIITGWGWYYTLSLADIFIIFSAFRAFSWYWQ